MFAVNVCRCNVQLRTYIFHQTEPFASPGEPMSLQCRRTVGYFHPQCGRYGITDHIFPAKCQPDSRPTSVTAERERHRPAAALGTGHGIQSTQLTSWQNHVLGAWSSAGRAVVERHLNGGRASVEPRSSHFSYGR